MHKHHHPPKHRVGDHDNVIEVTVEQHAELHLSEYLTHGLQEDWLAYRGLAGIISHEQAVSEAQSIAVTKANKTRVWSDQARESIAQSNIRRAKPVYCPELDKEWYSYTEAARDLGIKHEQIRRVVRGQRKTTRGLTFYEVG